MKLLTQQIKETLPPLHSQDAKGGKAVAYLKLCTLDEFIIYYITEFDGKDTLSGLAYGIEKKVGHFSLKELESLKSPLDFPLEHDFCWRPKTIEEIAPEMFQDGLK